MDDEFISIPAKRSAAAAAAVEQDSSDQKPPWFRASSFVPGDCLASLHNEVLDLCDLLQPTAEEIRDTATVLTLVQGLVLEGFGHQASVDVFGSQLTRLVLPTSDIDLIVSNAPTGAIFVLAKMLRRQMNCGGVHNLEVIAKARVPIIKFVHTNTGRHCDICFNMATGLKTAQMVTDIMTRMPTVRPLVLILKYFLAQRFLNETYQGGIGSFLLQLMVTSLVQHTNAQKAQEQYSYQNNLGSLLLSFLNLYGNKFNISTTAISLRDGGSYFKKWERRWDDAARPNLICVENPEDPDIDVGKNSYKVADCLKAFSFGYDQLVAVLARMDGQKANQQPSSILAALIFPDSTLATRSLPDGRVFRGG